MNIHTLLYLLAPQVFLFFESSYERFMIHYRLCQEVLIFTVKSIIMRCRRKMLRTDLVFVESPTAHGHALVGPFVLEFELLDLIVREAHYVRW